MTHTSSNPLPPTSEDSLNRMLGKEGTVWQGDREGRGSPRRGSQRNNNGSLHMPQIKRGEIMNQIKNTIFTINLPSTLASPPMLPPASSWPAFRYFKAAQREENSDETKRRREPLPSLGLMATLSLHAYKPTKVHQVYQHFRLVRLRHP